jgi:hypothetical protein
MRCFRRTSKNRNDGNPLIDGRGTARRLRGSLDVEARPATQELGAEILGWKRDASWFSFMVL